VPNRRRVVLLTLWILSVAAASEWSATQAQSTPQRGPWGEQILTGRDIGFMVFPNTSNQTRPAGTLVIRQQGQWVVPEMGSEVSPGSPRGRTVPLR
jgi:hypothetical protein